MEVGVDHLLADRMVHGPPEAVHARLGADVLAVTVLLLFGHRAGERVDLIALVIKDGEDGLATQEQRRAPRHRADR